MQPTLKIKVPPEIIDGTSTPLYAAYTVDNVFTVDMVYTVDTVNTVMWLKLLIWVMWLTRLGGPNWAYRADRTDIRCS